MNGLFDHALREKYNSMMLNDPLVFIKNTIDWDAFTQLLKNLYRNDKDNYKIFVKTDVKLLLMSMFNMVD